MDMEESLRLTMGSLMESGKMKMIMDTKDSLIKMDNIFIKSFQMENY